MLHRISSKAFEVLQSSDIVQHSCHSKDEALYAGIQNNQSVLTAPFVCNCVF